MIPLRTRIALSAAALAFAAGGLVVGGAGPARAAGPQTQAQMMPPQMGPGMGMGMAMPGFLPIFTPAASSLTGMQPYSGVSPSYSYSPAYMPSFTYSSGGGSALAQPAELQQVCHQYEVALQYNTQPDDQTLDQVCDVTGNAGSVTSPSTASGGTAGQGYP